MVNYFSFCNYLRGVEEIPHAQGPVSSKTLKTNLKLFLKFLSNIKKLKKLLFPRLFGVSTFLFVLLLTDLIALEFVVYQVGLLSGKFFEVLTGRDLSGFLKLALFSIALIVINSSMKSFNDFLARLLEIVWRKHITLKLHDKYFASKNFYYIQNLGADEKVLMNDDSLIINDDLNSLVKSDSGLVSVPPHRIIRNNRVNIERNSSTAGNGMNKNQMLDNPDQRITQDVNSLSESISKIVPLILISPFVIGWYGYQTFKDVGYAGPLAIFIYFIVWGLINGPFTLPIARVVYRQDKREGDFRFKHMNIRANAESIAFYNSGKSELDEMNKTFVSLLNISYKKNWKQFILNIFINTSQYMGGIIAYLILAIPILTDVYPDYTPTQIGQLINNYSFKCQYLIYLFTRLYGILNQMPVIAGNLQRVQELFDKMNHNIRQEKLNQSDETIKELNEDICFIANDVNIMLPDTKTVLIKNLNLRFEKNNRILITGRSGCGKTSIFRCLNGLWNSYSGSIIKNSKYNSKIFFLPQNSYFTTGSLLDQITYPTVGLNVDINKPEMMELMSNMNEWIRAFNLEHLLDKVDSDIKAKPIFNWQTVLSNGEQQRLSFLRILYHKPKFALLDEFTSSVDQDMESLMYEYLNKIDCTYMSIAHRDTVRKHHNYELKILNDLSCLLDDLTHSDFNVQV